MWGKLWPDTSVINVYFPEASIQTQGVLGTLSLDLNCVLNYCIQFGSVRFGSFISHGVQTDFFLGGDDVIFLKGGCWLSVFFTNISTMIATGGGCTCSIW